MNAVVVQSNQPRAWSSTMCQCCAPPGGCGNCLYVTFCGCCAAGEVAKAAGKDYCMSCCIIPFLLPCIQPCVYAWDRQAFANRYGIPDEGCFVPCLLFSCGCGACLLCQERNTVLAFTQNGTIAPNGQAPAQQTVVVIQASPGGQQMMGQAPAY